jgi:hypothetical protein
MNRKFKMQFKMQKKTWVTTIVCVAVVTIINVVNINLAKPDLSSISLSLNRIEAITSEYEANKCKTCVKNTAYEYSSTGKKTKSTDTVGCCGGTSSACSQGTIVYGYDSSGQGKYEISRNTETKSCNLW